jgi:hypothetical protein
MFGNPLNSRPAGVLVPENVSTEQAPQQKLVSFEEIKTYGIMFGDAEGRKHVGIAVYSGGRWYMPPNGEPWAQALRPAAEWLAKQLEVNRLAVSEAAPDAGDVPKEDVVDVMGGEKK